MGRREELFDYAAEIQWQKIFETSWWIMTPENALVFTSGIIVLVCLVYWSFKK